MPPQPTFPASARRVSEAKLFRSVDKTLPDDSWPVFHLREAIVLDRNGTKMENLLFVQQRGPFIVRGRVTTSPDDRTQMKALLKGVPLRDVEVEIIGLRMSIGYSGGPDLWVASDYGFFEIVRPSPSYAAVYRTMAQGITLYYTAMMAYEDAVAQARLKRKGQKPLDVKSFVETYPVKKILLKYAVAEGDGSILDEVVARCIEQAPFLRAHFLQEEQFQEEKLHWKDTSFYKWVMGLETTRSPTAPPQSDPLQGAALTRRTRRSPSSATNTPPPKAAPQTIVASSPVTNTTIVEPDTPIVRERTLRLAEHVFDLMESVAVEDGLTLSKATITSISSRLYLRCRFRDYHGPREGIEYLAAELTEIMKRPKTRRGWEESSFFQFLEPLSRGKRRALEKMTLETLETSFVRRRQMVTPRQMPESQTPRGTPGIVRGRGTPNLLSQSRTASPHSSRHSQERQRPQRGKQSGKIAGLRLATSSKKRPVSEVDDTDASASEGARRGGKSAKRAHYMVDEDEEEGDGEDVNGYDDEDDDSGNDDVDDSVADDDDNVHREATQLVVLAERIPSATPVGPNGVWFCMESDCGYSVAAGDDSQEEIKEHMGEHELLAKMINLAKVESRGHLPIDHLLEKLKQAGNRGVDDDGDTSVPQPIRKRLLV